MLLLPAKSWRMSVLQLAENVKVCMYAHGWSANHNCIAAEAMPPNGRSAYPNPWLLAVWWKSACNHRMHARHRLLPINLSCGRTWAHPIHLEVWCVPPGQIHGGLQPLPPLPHHQLELHPLEPHCQSLLMNCCWCCCSMNCCWTLTCFDSDSMKDEVSIHLEVVGWFLPPAAPALAELHHHHHHR